MYEALTPGVVALATLVFSMGLIRCPGGYSGWLPAAASASQGLGEYPASASSVLTLRLDPCRGQRRTLLGKQAVTPVTNPQPGDLVLYAGNGKIWDSPRTGKAVALCDIWSSTPTYGRP